MRVTPSAAGSLLRVELQIGLLGLMMWVAAASSAPIESPPSTAGETELHAIEKATSRFLSSFEQLDMADFIACFAEDATVFFPTPEPPERFNGKAAIRAHFQQVFDGIRKRASSGPPYHRLVPEDLEVQLLSPDAAIVSFHLRNTERLARRTLVWKKVQGTWLIAHIHASSVPRVTATARSAE